MSSEIPNHENDQIATCHGCDTIPAEYVDLKCSHNFCLQCLARIYIESKLQKVQENNNLCEIICPYDSEITILDENSVLALEYTIRTLEVSEENKNEVIVEESVENSRTDFPSKDKNIENYENDINDRKETGKFIDFPLKNEKKKNDYRMNSNEDNIILEKRLVQKRIKEIQKTLENCEIRKKLINSKVLECKKQIETGLSELKQRLDSKLNELLNQSDLFLLDKTKEIDKIISELHSELDLLQLKPSLESINKKTPKSIEEFEEFTCCLNMESFYSYLENLQTLKLEISSMHISHNQINQSQTTKEVLSNFQQKDNSNHFNSALSNKAYLLINEKINDFQKNTTFHNEKEPFLLRKHYETSSKRLETKFSVLNKSLINKSINTTLQHSFRESWSKMADRFSIRKKPEVSLYLNKSKQDNWNLKQTKGKNDWLLDALEKQKNKFEIRKKLIT